MKSSVAAIGMLAAVASAYYPARHPHFPRNNGTENMTTLTIKTTKVHTITSCAPTVTKCPAQQTAIASLPDNQKLTKVVTDEVVLTTVVCPVSSASKVASSVLNKASTGGIVGSTVTPTPTAPTRVPLTTAPPRGNGTEQLTTVTVKKTKTHTVTSCAPTVTNCPAKPSDIARLPPSERVTKVVTDEVVLTTVVCPVESASKVVSSIKADASATPVETKVTPVVTDKIVTFTQGTGSSASLVTSTIRTTIFKTITVPCSSCAKGGPGNGASPTPGGAPVNGDVPAYDITTTTTATTRIVRTKTVVKPKPTSGGDKSTPGNQDADKSTPGAEGPDSQDGECVASTVTVTVAKETVTVPASTVYVTMAPTGAAKPPVNNNVQKPKDDDDEDCEDKTTTLRTTVTVVPFPSGNSTRTSGVARPTGFARLRY